MHDLPRQKLTELLAQYGHGFCDDEKRLEAMLKDLLRNEHKRETFVLISALREGVVQDLRAPTAGMPLAAVTAKLVRQLRDNLALDESAARWGVESWAFALGVKITQPVVRVKKPAPLPVVVPASPPTVSPGDRLVLAASSEGDPSVSSSGGIDLATMALYHRTKAEQEKQHAAEIHQQAREFADDANDYDSAIELIESLDPKWRDQQLYLSICERRDQELVLQAKQHAAEVHRQAKQHAEQTRDFAGAARLIETLEPRWRDAKLYEKVCSYRDQVTVLDASIHDAVQKGRLQFLHGRVEELLRLQPKRDDMRRLLEVLPAGPKLPTEFTNSIGMKFMKFVLIKPGEFMMGSNNKADEGPPHSVEITRPFYLSVFPVTQAQYQAMTGTKPSRFTQNMAYPVKPVSWNDAVAYRKYCEKLSDSVSDTNPSRFTQYTARPVEQVSWNEAVAYCEKLRASATGHPNGWTYRLPTEAEWEYACRAGSSGKWSFGDDEQLLGEYAWIDHNSNKTTHPVGEKKANAWGLHDMYGNVWEWCEDVYNAKVYESRRGKTMSDPLVTSGSDQRVLRGGAWSDYSENSRSAVRGWSTPDNRLSNFGFRVVCSSSP